MKKTIVQLCTLFALLFSASCSNSYLDDCDILGIGHIDNDIFKQPTWRASLAELLQSNAAVLDSSGLCFISATPIDTFTLDSSHFFNNNYLSFPVYYGNLDRFQLVSYHDLCKDTTSFHYKNDYLATFVDSLLAIQHIFDKIKITWNYNGISFETISLFNKETKEIEYDNILFNLFFKKTYFKQARDLLSRGEVPSYGYNTVDHGINTIYFMSAVSVLLAQVSIDWQECGEWHPRTIQIDSLHNMTVYDYSHTKLCYNFSQWVYEPVANCVTTSYDLTEIDIPFGHSFKYYIWAGPNNTCPSITSIYEQIPFPGDEVSLSQPATLVGTAVNTAGTAKYQVVYPYKSPQYAANNK